MSGSINLFQFVCKTLQFQMLRQQQQQQQHLTSRATENDNAQRCLACLPARGNNFALLYRLLVIPRRTREDSRRHIAEHVYLQTVKQEGQQARGGTQSTLLTGRQADRNQSSSSTNWILIVGELSGDISHTIASRRTIRAISLQKLRRLARDCHKSKRH